MSGSEEDGDKPILVTIKVPPKNLEAYGRSASKAGISRHAWMRIVLDAASGASELPDQLTRVVEFKPRPVRDGEW